MNGEFFCFLLTCIAYLFKAIAADELASEILDTVGIVAENAGRAVLFENDLIVVYENLDGIAV